MTMRQPVPAALAIVALAACIIGPSLIYLYYHQPAIERAVHINPADTHAVPAEQFRVYGVRTEATPIPRTSSAAVMTDKSLTILPQEAGVGDGPPCRTGWKSLGVGISVCQDPPLPEEAPASMTFTATQAPFRELLTISGPGQENGRPRLPWRITFSPEALAQTTLCATDVFGPKRAGSRQDEAVCRPASWIVDWTPK